MKNFTKAAVVDSSNLFYLKFKTFQIIREFCMFSENALRAQKWQHFRDVSEKAASCIRLTRVDTFIKRKRGDKIYFKTNFLNE
jgi:hypothetical protein